MYYEFFLILLFISSLVILSYKFGIFISFIRNFFIIFSISLVGRYFLSEFLNVGTYNPFTNDFYSEFDRYIDYLTSFKIETLYKKFIYLILLFLFTFFFRRERINNRSTFVFISLISLMLGFFFIVYIDYELDTYKANIFQFIINLSFAIIFLLIMFFDLININKSKVEEKFNEQKKKLLKQ